MSFEIFKMQTYEIWWKVVHEELQALDKNHTWTIGKLSNGKTLLIEF